MSSPPSAVKAIQGAPLNTSLNLFLLAILHRLWILLLIFLSSLFLVPFDTSSSLQRLTSAPSLASHLSTALVRWDSLHFLALASPLALPRGQTSADRGGYRYEHSTAFQPGIVWVLRWTGMMGADADLEQWDADVAVLVTSALAALAGALSIPLLYRLLLRHTRSHTLSSLAAHLSILSPSPATLITPTPEPFYSLFALLGLVALAPAPGEAAGRKPIASVLGASAALGMATCFRANGILNVGFVWWELFWVGGATKPKHFGPRLVSSLLLLLPCTILVTAPFLLTQRWAWTRFCAPASIEPRPWCGDGGWTDVSPWFGAYGYVQHQYWGVGLFSYWTPAQLPNFALAAPILYLVSHRLYVYLASSPRFLGRRVLTPWLEESRETDKDTDDASHPALLSASSHPSLIPLFLHTALQASLLLFHSHVQITLRFASPGGMPLFWALLAHTVLAARSGQGTDKVRSEAKMLLWWLVLWNVTSAVLYAAFYPPA